MQLIRSQDYELKPWKNGLGKTREIIGKSAGEKLAWRLSLAIVESDGQFSNFDGFDRILTVVRGAGMRLIGSDAVYEAQPFTPIRFPGGERITGRCYSVPIENFNLIFDPEQVTADVRIVSGAEISGIASGPDETTILHVLKGYLPCPDGQTLAAQDSGVCEGPLPALPAAEGVRCAVVTLAHR